MAKKFISNKDETVRMFRNDFLESLSKVHPAVPLIIFVPVILYMLYFSIFTLKISALSIVGLIIFGLFIWTITEYLLHRFIFHWELKSKLGARIHFIFHGGWKRPYTFILHVQIYKYCITHIYDESTIEYNKIRLAR